VLAYGILRMQRTPTGRTLPRAAPPAAPTTSISMTRPEATIRP